MYYFLNSYTGIFSLGLCISVYFLCPCRYMSRMAVRAWVIRSRSLSSFTRSSVLALESALSAVRWTGSWDRISKAISMVDIVKTHGVYIQINDSRSSVGEGNGASLFD